MSDKKSVIYRFCVYGGSWLIWPPVIDDLDRDLFDVWNSSCNERVSYIELYASFTAHTCTSSEYATAVTKPHQVAPNSTFPPSMCNRYTKPNHVSRYRSCLFAPKYFRRKSAKRLHHAACGPQGVRLHRRVLPLGADGHCHVPLPAYSGRKAHPPPVHNRRISHWLGEGDDRSGWNSVGTIKVGWLVD